MTLSHPFLSCLHSASYSSTFSNLAFKLIDPVKLLLPVPHDLFFFLTNSNMPLSLCSLPLRSLECACPLPCTPFPWRCDILLPRLPSSLALPSQSLLVSILLFVKDLLCSYYRISLCFFFFFFHLLVWLFPPLCIDGLHISSPEFFPEPQTHIFRCYSWSHLHNLQGTLMYRCELLLKHTDTHTYTVCFNSMFPFLGNGLSIQLSKAEIIFRHFLLPH